MVVGILFLSNKRRIFMKKIKKVVIALVLCVAVILPMFTFAGCFGDAENKNATEIGKLSVLVEQAQTKLEELEEENDALQAEIDGLESAQSQDKSKIEALESENEELKAEIAKQAQIINKLEAISILEGAILDYQAATVKAVDFDYLSEENGVKSVEFNVKRVDTYLESWIEKDNYEVHVLNNQNQQP